MTPICPTESRPRPSSPAMPAQTCFLGARPSGTMVVRKSLRHKAPGMSNPTLLRCFSDGGFTHAAGGLSHDPIGASSSQAPASSTSLTAVSYAVMDTENANERDDKPAGPAVSDSSVPAADTSAVCATCGSALQQWGAEGGCLRCLVDFVSVPDEEVPADGSHDVPNRRYGHFEVSTTADGQPLELGHGAMGTTYRAYDTVLDCDVALKIIDRRFAEHPAARARFLREARMAAKLRHPNVASVFQYGEQEGECFYTMELVDGETLEARVQREGPLPPALALEIMIQAARALAAAEVHGVIHRDLKPTNLMLTTRKGESDGENLPVVKVIDFGLAKAVTAAAEAAGATETRGGFVGTPAFASPEQFGHAENVLLDRRSDIYSLGATMWYALCGQAPFTGRTLEEIHAQQNDPLPVAQLSARGVPEPLVTLLQSMLNVHLAARPQSASGLLEALRHCREQLQIVTHTTRSPWKFRLAAALILLLLVALAALWKPGGKSTIRADDRSIAVLPFENLSPNPDDAFFTKGMQDEITADLAHVSALKVIGPDSTRGNPPGKRDFARIGQELGVGHLLTGNVRREGGQVRVNVQMIDPHDPFHPWSGAYVRPLADVFVVQGEITRAITDRLQIPLSTEEKNAIDEPPTTDLAAYDLYLRADELPTFTTTPEALFASLTKQVAFLDAAVARDPKFVLAYCALATAHDTFYQYRNYAPPTEQAVDHRAQAETALQIARRLRPEAGEVHLAAATHFLLINRDNDQARVELDLARRTLPNSATLEKTAGTIAGVQGRWEDALRALHRAVALNPRDEESRDDLALTYRLLRRYGDCEREMTANIDMMPASDAPLNRCELALVNLERDADVGPLRASVAALPKAEYHAGNDVYALILHLCEHDPAAVSRVVASAPVPKFMINGCVYPKGWFEGLAARMRGDAAGAQTAFAAARLDAEKVVSMDATNGLHLSMLAMIDAGLGRTDDAVREGLRACEILPPSKSVTKAVRVSVNLAVVYAWTGQTDLAIGKLAELVRGPSGYNLPIQPSYGDLELNPIWDPLRSDPRFAALKQTLAPNAPSTTVTAK